jgi:hypothetical protein
MKVMSMRGELLDVGRYLAMQEKQVAVGNGKMNARGDVIGRGGAVVKPREQVVSEYYAQNPKAIRNVSLKDMGADPVSEQVFSPAEALEQALAEAPPAPPPAPKRGRRLSE